jgi:V/A-type H+-transporting ATPase subunit D
MAKIKHTKNELKVQRDALARYTRYLPTLQLKQQQLQAEARKLREVLEGKAKEITRLYDELNAWEALYSEPVSIEDYLELGSIRTRLENIAGVSAPVLQDIQFKESTPDLFETPAWLDEGLETIKVLSRLWVEIHIIRKQYTLVNEELRITTQRVNLFEKVKIPESKENIRVIRIFLGDEQTSGVVRAKIAKQKNMAKEAAAS